MEIYKLIDTHAHLDEIIESIDKAVSEARHAGVIAIIAVGQDYESNLKVLEISEKYPGFVYPALGLHPWSLGNADAKKVSLILQQIEDNIHRIVAIGEVGLDYDKRVVASADKERQKAAFRLVLELAQKYEKALSVHSRYSWKDSYDLVKEYGIKQAVFHWYTGLSSVLREIIAEGYFISATPATEYHDEHRRAVRETPLESLMLETDCPVTYGRESKFQAYPADVVRTLKSVAQLKAMPEKIIAEQTTANALRFFGLDRQIKCFWL
ncbi:MAG: TatD family deoxyribonuclease [Chloroflexi bacterium]|nr:TatD family deoxyribonuclease [Chloroflexota bacterium]